jgi:hypothetical protein
MHEHQEGIAMNHDARFADSLKKLLHNIQGYMPSSTISWTDFIT